MALVTINVSDDQLRTIYSLADSQNNGNVSELIRGAITEKYPIFAAAKPTRPRRQRQELKIKADDGKKAK